jgi:hypothetical protein
LLNYYEILGLKNDAEIGEIKAAFRQLAKLYHPDINPEGKEQFTVIVKAYETLSDPNLKYSYDYKLNSQAQSKPADRTRSAPKDKNWRFDEREMKRRQYYNEHIKKYEKKFTSSAAQTEQKSNYNEFKYILFATPLAVLLFLGIMTLASKNRTTTEDNQRSEPEKPIARKTSDLKMGDAPYAWYFGAQAYDTANKTRLIVKNLTGRDVIVCLFAGKKFVRSFFVESSYSAEVTQLLRDSLAVRYSSGLYFNHALKLPGTDVTGAFSEKLLFFKSDEPVNLNTINELTLSPGKTEGFRQIDAHEFFTL